MLIIYHLAQSRSGRIIWLAEELGLPYELVRFERGWQAPPPLEYQALHPLGRSPIVRDGGRVITESVAIFEYILATYGKGRLAPAPMDQGYVDFLEWFHFAEGSLSPHHLTLWVLSLAGVTEGKMWDQMMESLAKDVAYADSTLAQRPYIAGEAFTAADIMMCMALRAPKQFADALPPHPHVDAYLDRLKTRPAYKRAGPFD